MKLFKFPNEFIFDNELNYNDLDDSLEKLQGLVRWFNNVLNQDDTQDGWKESLDGLKSKIIDLKTKLGITENIQPYYF